jgi:hypothetical protein
LLLLHWVLGGSRHTQLVLQVLELRDLGHRHLELEVPLSQMQWVFKLLLLHIKELELPLVIKGHLGFRLAKQLPRLVLQQLRPPPLVLLVIRLGLLGRAKCLVLRSGALVFRVDTDGIRYINSKPVILFMTHIFTVDSSSFILYASL